MIAIVTFVSSFLGLLALFSLKAWAEKRKARIFPRARTSLDQGALWLKARLEHAEELLVRVPPFVALLSRFFFAKLMLRLARLAHSAADTAHHLADMVSYKHKYERRETRSEFLKKVTEHPIRNSREVNSSEAGKNGQSGDSSQS